MLFEVSLSVARSGLGVNFLRRPLPGRLSAVLNVSRLWRSLEMVS